LHVVIRLPCSSITSTLVSAHKRLLWCRCIVSSRNHRRAFADWLPACLDPSRRAARHHNRAQTWDPPDECAWETLASQPVTRHCFMNSKPG
jgi:hypothetical protein